jgi:hypothetical protein
MKTKQKATRAKKLATPKQQVRSKAARAHIAEGTRLFALAERPTKAQFIKVYGPQGTAMTWQQRAKAGWRQALSGRSGGERRGLTTAGFVTIGTGGTPIAEYVSATYSATLPALTSGSCCTFTTAALTGFTPGSSDTIALGLPKSLVSSLGGNIFLIYQAWETTTTASPTVTIQVCNPTGSRYGGGATGTIRVDIWKH